jgi:hypothetical protein
MQTFSTGSPSLRVGDRAMRPTCVITVLPYARDEKTARRLWDDSADLVGLPH